MSATGQEQETLFSLAQERRHEARRAPVPVCRLFLAGQSLGGSILTKFLAETRTPYPVLAAAASVSAPRAFAKANASLDSGVVNKIQNFCMTLPMKLGYALQTDPRAYDGRVLRATSIRDIETALVQGGTRARRARLQRRLPRPCSTRFG